MNESLFVIDKPAGPTSFDVVRGMKRLFRDSKVGHAGSLDPFATGVLVVLVGKATKHSNLLLNADKSYRALVKFGTATDSMDRTGNVTETKEVPEFTEESIRAVLEAFEGEWMQTPPMYSAKKINGVRLYELARQNISVPRESAPVQLHEMKFLSYTAPFLDLEVRCSKGTYIRSLADELARRLGTVGHLHELRRLTCGEFTLADSVTPDQLSADGIEKWMDRGRKNYTKLLRGGRTLFPGSRPAGTTSTIANATLG